MINQVSFKIHDRSAKDKTSSQIAASYDWGKTTSGKRVRPKMGRKTGTSSCHSVRVSSWEYYKNDLLSWLLNEAPPELKNVHDLTLRILVINFAAIHTTSMVCSDCVFRNLLRSTMQTFTNALYQLAAFPDYIKPLREEIETVVNEHGWNKTSIGKMRKLDSLLKESQRLTGLSSSMSLASDTFSHGITVSMNRMVLKDFTFSDGTTIPAGTMVTAASYATHHDEVCIRSFYITPKQFSTGCISRSRQVSCIPFRGYARIWVSQAPHGDTEPRLSAFWTREACLSRAVLCRQWAQGHDGSCYTDLRCQARERRSTAST